MENMKVKQERKELKRKKTNWAANQRQIISKKTAEETAGKKELLKERVERIYHSLHLQP